jgi:DtxR family Mn-dependent transcriptional regulator
MKLSAKAEEILEALWIATVEGGENAALLQTLGVGPEDEGLRELDRLAYIEVRGERVYCLLYTSPSPRDRQKSRMPSSA